MSRRLRSANVLLERINDIDAECSEDDQEILDMENDNTENYDPLETDSNTDENEENISNVRRRRKRRRFLVSSDSENEEETSEIAMDGTVWQEVKIGSNPGRAPGHNIFRETSGPTGYSKRNIMKGEVRTAFSVIIDKNIIELIRKCTEAEAFRVLGYKWELSTAKLYAFFAILYARGAYEAKNIDIALLWNKKWGPPFFSNTMSRHDFTEIMRFIRFDDRNKRSQRLQTDKFAMISEVWYKFIDNSQNCYKPGPYITIDEQLFPTKARCRFTQYMPNKPDKFGIKFWLASDVHSKYIINGFPYLGKDESREPSVPLGEFVTMKLAEPYVGCGRNITTENFFTSLPLATKLLAKKTTIVGTIRANRKELPRLAKLKNDDMTLFSTKLYRSNNCMLTIYKAKPRKKVLILSSMHNSVQVEENDTRTPETIQLYNSTKFGVDVTDQMARNYSVKSKSRRWPLQVFFNILDLAGINAWVLYKETTGGEITRQEFLFQLAEELAIEYQQELSKENQPIPIASTSTGSRERKTCQIRYCKDNKTNKICLKCKKYVCGKCTVEKPICKKCDEKE
ncbi:PiggyBac transposable element-derived protein 4 [Anthophora quadrimaculata]